MCPRPPFSPSRAPPRPDQIPLPRVLPYWADQNAAVRRDSNSANSAAAAARAAAARRAAPAAVAASPRATTSGGTGRAGVAAAAAARDAAAATSARQRAMRTPTLSANEEGRGRKAQREVQPRVVAEEDIRRGCLLQERWWQRHRGAAVVAVSPSCYHHARLGTNHTRKREQENAKLPRLLPDRGRHLTSWQCQTLALNGSVQAITDTTTACHPYRPTGCHAREIAQADHTHTTIKAWAASTTGHSSQPIKASSALVTDQMTVSTSSSTAATVSASPMGTDGRKRGRLGAQQKKKTNTRLSEGRNRRRDIGRVGAWSA